MEIKHLWLIAAIVVLVVGGVFLLTRDTGDEASGATIGSRLIENYVPVIRDAGLTLTSLPYWSTSSSTIEGNFTSNGTTTLGHYYSIGNVDYYDIQDTFQNSTTTIFAVQNPWLATSTVYYSQIDITTGASSSLAFYVGTSTAANTLNGLGLGCIAAAGDLLVACDGVIIDEANVPTSTAATGGTFGNVTATIATGFGSLVNIFDKGTGINGGSLGVSHSSLVVGPSEWVIGYATTTFAGGTSYQPSLACALAAGGCADGGSDGITNTGNSFDGTFLLRFIRP